MLLQNIMTRLTPHTCLLPRLNAQSRRTYALSVLLVLGLATPMLTVWAEPELSSNESALVTETTITEITTTEVSDRESRLRNMEDELLKQLSVGNQPSAREGTKPSLADIKQVSDEVAAPKSSPSKPATAKQLESPPTNSKPSVKVQNTADIEAKVPVVDYESIPNSPPRAPQAASVVPVSAKSAPQRKFSAKRHTTTETLSAKDLEHRLAITETQLNLVTQELESTKSKLATAESRVRELTYQLGDGSRASTSGSDATSNVEARAVAVKVVEPDTRPSIDTEVARVTKNKTPLRIGPGPRESIITHLARDNVVSIEHRTSGWYRVITSDGARGWIAGTYLVFDTDMYSDSTVHVGAFEPRLEPTSGRY